jgi:4-amino-4-deoxy-L-arabinose transferase-like glycosyltransferase/membrane-associated phospholipid phosphatase
MQWAQALDARLFHLINPALSNSFFDTVMPFLSGNRFFAPALILVCIFLCCRGGARGRLCVFMLILAVALGDTFVCNTIKQAVARPRPFFDIADTHMPASVGRTDSGSMPSSHAANWFAATVVCFIYYRRSIRFMLPLALLVGFSRIYNGVHYPSDVLAGAILGAGYAAGGVWSLNALWQWAGRRWFPLWWQRLPSLIEPDPRPPIGTPDPRELDRHLMRLAYVLIFALLVCTLAFIASGKVELSEDEAYQWNWSKHLALSYYSKPLLIAVTQFLGTSIWGDTAFGVRFFAPVIGAILSLLTLRFLARVANVRAAFWLSLIVPTVPLLAVGSILMTIDPLSVMFWTLAMIAGWRAIQDNSTTRDWFWVGLWMGLGFLSKYTGLFQLLSWVVLFAIWPPARKHLRRPGPWLALLVNLLCTLPVIIWNNQNHWITLQHVAEGGHFDKPWAFTPANLWDCFSKYTTEFFAAEAALWNPFYFLPVIWALVVFWKRCRNNALMLYFFSMGAPLFLCYFLFTLHSRVLPNWIAPAILPMLCLAAVFWDAEWRSGRRAVRYWLFPGLIIGCLAVVILHDTRLLNKAGINLRRDLDPSRRLQGWHETARIVEAARQKLEAEGKPVFIIGGHYGITGEVSFYLPEARQGVPDHPLVYFQSSDVPMNQFFFWPGYHDRKGQNAIFIQALDLPATNAAPIPPVIIREFETVKDLGTVMVLHEGQPTRRIQIVECRNLR